MFVHPQFDPVAVSIGPFSVHWYGLMYLVGFLLFWLLGQWRARRDSWREMTPEDVEDLLFWVSFWAVDWGIVSSINRPFISHIPLTSFAFGMAV